MQNFDVNKLRVASPCSMNWENMSGDERARFCQSCQLNVYNLSELTANEIKQLISQKEGRICGRLYKRADGTVITKDCPIGLRAMRKRISRRASAVFATALSLFTIGLSQSQTKPDNTAKITRSKTVSASKLQIQVIDAAGATMPNVRITLTNLKAKKKISAETDENGEILMENLATGFYDLKLSHYGYSTKKIRKLAVIENETIVLEVQLEPNGTLTIGLFASNNSIYQSSTEFETEITAETK